MQILCLNSSYLLLKTDHVLLTSFQIKIYFRFLLKCMKILFNVMRRKKGTEILN